jgi:hypothetical protein
MSGGKQTSETKIPEWLSAAAQQGLGRANSVASIGYTPYYGPDVAAMTPMQDAAMSNINTGASAFGMAAPTSSGMPEAQTFAGGVRGYSSAPMYEAAVAELKARYPGAYNAIMGQFSDPMTGAMPTWMQPPAAAQPVAPAAMPMSSRSDRSAAEIAALAPSRGGGTSSITNWASSRLPGGVHDRNLTSPINQAIARATQAAPRAPTQADRPISRSSASAATKSTFRGGR